jgi:hypothetical protein
MQTRTSYARRYLTSNAQTTPVVGRKACEVALEEVCGRAMPAPPDLPQRRIWGV